MRYILLLFVTSLLSGLASSQTGTIQVPLGGNAWLSANGKAHIGDSGLTAWNNPHDTVNIWLRTEAAGSVQITLRLQVPEGNSHLRLLYNKQVLNREAGSSTWQEVNFGQFTIDKPGYQRFQLTGISRTGSVYANVSDLLAQGSALQNGAAWVADNEDNYFYWGQRGPSVHLNYPVDSAYQQQVEWFYTEVESPAGYDPEGSYFMADGFKGGYFGMQVNSPTERRILFSVWSPFNSDNPASIPDSLKIILLKKGKDVHTGEFGNEGAGGQSYLRYNWQAGTRYAFLLHAQADSIHKTTTFTAWFAAAATRQWQLIASFKRPQSGFLLQQLYSFTENFEPAMGNRERKAFFANQWIKDTGGQWHELTKALFTGDATANKNYRKDYGGGSNNSYFYLRNGGFFSNYTPLKTPLQRSSSGNKPPDFIPEQLP